MSQFDGTGEKRRDGGDSGAFRGRRHPFLDRRVDWKEIDKKRLGGESSGDVSDRAARPSEISPFELTNAPDPRYQRVEKCVAAVKQLSTNMDRWYVIRDCLIEEYQSAGPEPSSSEKALTSFIASVNRRLGNSGEINVERLSGEPAQQVARAEGLLSPELTLNVRVWHSGGLMGPIGVCFTNQGAAR
jgi:hypothetical protein